MVHSIWHEALTLVRSLAGLCFERWDDDCAGVAIVVVVQYGGLCVVCVIVVGGGSRLHSVRAVVAGTVGLRGIMDCNTTDHILPLL